MSIYIPLNQAERPDLARTTNALSLFKRAANDLMKIITLFHIMRVKSVCYSLHSYSSWRNETAIE